MCPPLELAFLAYYGWISEAETFDVWFFDKGLTIFGCDEQLKVGLFSQERHPLIELGQRKSIRRFEVTTTATLVWLLKWH